MSDTLPVRVLELLASKICHDLISPVGAVSNGVEILEEMGGEEDVISLISYSAAQANAKLRTMRMAYGLGGADYSVKAEDVHKTFGDFIAGEGRITQDWDPYALAFTPREGMAKMMLCALLLLQDSLPKGGVLGVESDCDSEITISARGDVARFRDGVLHAIAHNTDIDQMEPKLVHAYVTKLFADRYGFIIHIENDAEDVIYLRLENTSVS